MNLYESIKKNLKESYSIEEVKDLLEELIGECRDYPENSPGYIYHSAINYLKDVGQDKLAIYLENCYDRCDTSYIKNSSVIDDLRYVLSKLESIKESVKVGPIYKLGTEDYITSYNDIRLDEVGITLEDIELFKRVDTSNTAPDKVNYLLYVDMRWDGDDTTTVPISYNITDGEYEDEINPSILGIYDEDLDLQVYGAVDEVVRDLALRISHSGRLSESTETRLANLGVKGKKPELKTVVLDGKEMMDYLKNDMEGKFPEFEKQITDDDHMIYFLTDLDKGKWDFDKMRIEEKVDSICPVCGDHHRFVKEENGKRYYSCPLCKYDEDEDNIYESEKLKEAGKIKKLSDPDLKVGDKIIIQRSNHLKPHKATVIDIDRETGLLEYRIAERDFTEHSFIALPGSKFLSGLKNALDSIKSDEEDEDNIYEAAKHK